MRADFHRRAVVGFRGNLPSDRVLAAFALVAAAALGWAISVIGTSWGTKPLWLLLAIFCVVPLLFSPTTRLLFVVGAGLFVFQSSVGVTVAKAAYLGGALVAVVGALLQLPRLKVTEAFDQVRGVMRLSLVLAVFVACRSLLAIVAGTSLSLVIRDAGSVLLFCAVPLLALDATTTNPRFLRLFFVWCGVLGTLVYAITYATRRSGGDYSLVLYTGMEGGFPFAIVCFTAAGAILGRKPWLWGLATAVLLGFALATGNRIAFIGVLLGFLAIVVSGRGRLRRMVRLAIVAPIVILLGIWSLSIVAQHINVSTSQMGARFDTLLHPFALSQDGSFQVRASETAYTWQVFETHSILGVGPGYQFQWQDPRDPAVFYKDFELDSPLLLPAKYGIVGLALIVALCVSYLSMTRSLARDSNIYTMALLGFLVAELVWALTQAPPTDYKGFQLALIPLLALSLQSHDALRLHGSGPSRLQPGVV
jgi:hypothetical protein